MPPRGARERHDGADVTAQRHDRWLAAAICGFETAAALYAIIRAVQALLIDEPNPATIMQGAHAGFFWRAWIAAYGGGFVALTVALLSGPPHRLFHVATRTLPFAAALLVAQSLFLP
jgi:hypothetical protein